MLKEIFLQEWHDLPLTVGPCVDGSFLPQHPASLLRHAHYSDNVDVMIGTVQDEGNLLTAGTLFTHFFISHQMFHTLKNEAKERIETFIFKSVHSICCSNLEPQDSSAREENKHYRS